MLRLHVQWFLKGAYSAPTLLSGKRGAVFLCHIGGGPRHSILPKPSSVASEANNCHLGALVLEHWEDGSVMFRTALVSFIAVLLVWIGAAEPTLAQAPRKPKQIDVIANDYAFLPLPENIAAGPTIFTFENQGKVWHEVNIARLRSSATLEEFTKAEGLHRRDLIERSVGILIGGPGNRSDGRILVNLMKGSTYVAYCNFKDTPDAPAHLTFGMYKSFRPR